MSRCLISSSPRSPSPSTTLSHLAQSWKASSHSSLLLDRTLLTQRHALAVAFGITGKDYVLLASDTSAARSIVKMKSNEDKQRVVGKHLVMACQSPHSSSCLLEPSHPPPPPPAAASSLPRQLAR